MGAGGRAEGGVVLSFSFVRASPSKAEDNVHLNCCMGGQWDCEHAGVLLDKRL